MYRVDTVNRPLNRKYLGTRNSRFKPFNSPSMKSRKHRTEPWNPQCCRFLSIPFRSVPRVHSLHRERKKKQELYCTVLYCNVMCPPTLSSNATADPSPLRIQHRRIPRWSNIFRGSLLSTLRSKRCSRRKQYSPLRRRNNSRELLDCNSPKHVSLLIDKDRQAFPILFFFQALTGEERAKHLPSFETTARPLTTGRGSLCVTLLVLHLLHICQTLAIFVLSPSLIF